VIAVASPRLYRNRLPLILASASPRRKELLCRLGIRCVVRPAEIPEDPLPGEGPEEHVRRLARAKALAVAEEEKGWVLGADTVVVLEGRILGKPKGPGEAEKMLTLLSNRSHEVLTGYFLANGGEGIAGCGRTRVRFRDLSPGLIKSYVATGEPLDKAGAYGIQGMGAALVAEVQGSYTNVVGLPLAAVVEELERAGVIVPVSFETG